MASVYLDPNDTFTVSNSNTKVYGTTGTEVITVATGVTGVTFDQGIERVALQGNASAYTYQQQGINLVVYSGTTVVATVPLQADANGTQITFANGTVNALVGSTGMTLGGTAVVAGTTAATATTPTPATVDTTVVTPSTAPVVTVPTFSVTGAAEAAEAATASFVVALTNRAAGTAYTVTTALAATGGATAGTDFASTLTLDAASTAAGITLTAGVLTIPAASTVSSVTLSTTVTADATSPEAGEGLSLTLSAPTGTSAVLDTAKTVATTTITDVPVTYTLTASAANVYEGAPITYTLTASAPSTTATNVDFSVVAGDVNAANAGTPNTNFSDFSQGVFNPSTVVMAANATTATYTVTSSTDAVVELPENYSVKAVIGTTTVATKTTSLLDGNGGIVSTTPITFTLTTGADAPALAGGDDVINGVIDQATATNSTINAADIIAGGSGNDTLNITGVGTTLDVLNSAQVSGIETVNVRATTANSLNASQIAGLTAVNANLGTGTLLVTNLATGASIGVKGNGTVVQGEVAFAPATAASAITLNFMDGVAQTAGADAVTAAETIAAVNATGTATTATINSTGAANVTGIVDLASATLTSVTVNAATNLTGNFLSQATDQVATGGIVTISGAASSVNFTAALDNDIAGINASGLTAGGLTATLGTLSTQTVIGGAGNDVITTSGTVLTTGSVNAGAGTDTLILGSNVADANTTTLAAKFTNFETLRLQGTYDMALMPSITALQLTAGASSITNLTATQAAAVQARGDLTTTTLTLANAAGTADVLNLTMGTGGTGTGATFDSGVLTATGFETINLNANPGSTSTTGANRTSAFTGAIVDTSLNAINLTGTAFDFSDISSTKVLTINGSALTGDGATPSVGLTVAGNATVGSTITGSAVRDAITLGTVGSTYNLGAGNDTISGTLAQYRSGTVYNTIDAGAGTDTATISGGAALTMVDDDFKFLTNVENITVATTAANDQSITTGGWFNTGFNATGATFTTTSTTGAVVIAAGSFTGNLTVVATTGAVVGTNAITTGSGNDSVTFTNTSVTVSNSISTGAGNDTVVGSAAAESITGGTGTDQMTGSGGIDTFVFGTNGSIAGTSMDVITDWNTAGADVMTFSGNTTVLAADATTLVAGSNVQTSAGGLVTFATADATLALKIAAVQADTQLDVAGSIAIFTDGANQYVYYAGAAAGNTDDQLIQLSGITSLATITGGATTTIA